jgi:transcriptional regulator with XRE-family HTH domain
MEKLKAHFKSKRGSQRRLAEYLTLSPSTICEWVQVPIHWLAEVEMLTGIPRSQLRPDLFEAISRGSAYPIEDLIATKTTGE